MYQSIVLPIFTLALNPLFGVAEFVKYLMYIKLSVENCEGGLSLQKLPIRGEFSVPPSRITTPASEQLQYYIESKLFKKLEHILI